MDSKDFVLELRAEAEKKVKEYRSLLHEINRLEMRAVRTKEYIEQLNNFVKVEGNLESDIVLAPHREKEKDNVI